MKAVTVMDKWLAGIINVDIPGGIETTAGWVNNGDWHELAPEDRVSGAMLLFDSAYSMYLPVNWPVLKFWDMEMKESFFVTDVFFDKETDAFLCSDGKYRDKVMCVCPLEYKKEESNG